jgi:hypothetical protein
MQVAAGRYRFSHAAREPDEDRSRGALIDAGGFCSAVAAPRSTVATRNHRHRRTSPPANPAWRVIALKGIVEVARAGSEKLTPEQIRGPSALQTREYS